MEVLSFDLGAIRGCHHDDESLVHSLVAYVRQETAPIAAGHRRRAFRADDVGLFAVASVTAGRWLRCARCHDFMVDERDAFGRRRLLVLLHAADPAASA